MTFRGSTIPKVFILFQISLATICHGQTFHFPLVKANDNIDIRSDERVSCLYRISENKADPTVYRKVFLDERLRLADSIDYTIPGKARLMTSDANDLYTIHVFHVTNAKVDWLYFIVARKNGEIYSTFSKSAEDFAGCFAPHFNKASQVSFSFVENNTSPEMLIITPKLARGSVISKGRTIAFSASDGRLLWILEGPLPLKIVTTADKLIGVCAHQERQYASFPAYSMNIHDKSDGQLIHAEPIYPGAARQISVFTSNGSEVMIAGITSAPENGKQGRFYMTMFDVSGKIIFDKIDTAGHLSPSRMRALGHLFDKDGNLFLIGEGWKANYTTAIALTTLSILSAVMLRTYPDVYTQPDHKITSLVMAKISPVDGSVRDFYSFPVGPWGQHSSMITDGARVLITNSHHVLFYNTEEPQKPPVPFANLNTTDGLILLPTGPLVLRPAGKQIGLEVLRDSGGSR